MEGTGAALGRCEENPAGVAGSGRKQEARQPCERATDLEREAAEDEACSLCEMEGSEFVPVDEEKDEDVF